MSVRTYHRIELFGLAGDVHAGSLGFRGMDPVEVGRRIVESPGPGAAQELLDVLRRPEEERAAVIGRLFTRENTVILAEALTDVETDPDDLTRLALIDALHRVLGC